ncbi:histidine kinase [Gracilibacillus marinus]|uniref:histidine kinase n=1 Tax=Gracilibacillus marinus TaxID=630535 RepID=A0ABV8VYK9_9BACI
MKNIKIKVSHKLLAIYILVTAIPILLVGAYLNYSTREIVLKNVRNEVETSVDKMEMSLHNIFDRVTNTSDLIYLNEELKTILSTDYNEIIDIYNTYNQYTIFKEMIKHYDEIENIQFFMNKNMITDSYFIHADNVIRNNDWYKEAVSKRGKISWVYMEEQWTKRNYLALTRAVYGNTNELLGVLAIYIAPDSLQSVIEGESYNTFITLDKKLIIHHENRQYIGYEPSFQSILESSKEDSFLIDTVYNEEEVTLNIHEMVPDKSLDNTIQITTIIPTEEIMQEPNKVFQQGLVIISFVLIVSVLLIGIFIRSFSSRIQQLRQTMFQVAKGNFQIKTKVKGTDEISQVFEDLETTSKSVQKIIDEVYIHKIKEETWKRKQKEIDFKMLASQINPHFLYNTLEMIRMKALINKDPEVAKIIKILSKMMRSALERTDKPVSIKEEIQLIEHYLEIQKLRFGDQIEYRLNVEESVCSYRIYPLLIQPIVENAIIHGLEQKEEPGYIIVSMIEEDRQIVIEVKDNGIGMSKETLQEVNQKINDVDYQSNGNRIGLHNVQQRLRLLYGEEYYIHIESIQGLGTTMTINIPKNTM